MVIQYLISGYSNQSFQNILETYGTPYHYYWQQRQIVIAEEIGTRNKQT